MSIRLGCMLHLLYRVTCMSSRRPVRGHPLYPLEQPVVSVGDLADLSARHLAQVPRHLLRRLGLPSAI